LKLKLRKYYCSEVQVYINQRQSIYTREKNLRVEYKLDMLIMQKSTIQESFLKSAAQATGIVKIPLNHEKFTVASTCSRLSS
jgi:hypothetical protein